jgi:hypothetical protein
MRRGFVRSVLLAVVLACGWQATVAAPVLAQRGQSAPRPDPATLWKAYPLKPREQPLPPPREQPLPSPREQPLPPTKPAASAAQTRTTAPGSSDGRQSSPLLLVSVVVTLAILAGGVLVVSLSLRPAWAPGVAWRSPRGRRPVYGARQPRRLLRRLSEGGLVVNKFVHRFLHLGGERHDDGSEVVAGASEPAGPVSRRDISMRGKERNETVQQARNATPQSGSDTDKAPVDGGRTEVGRA